jgi:hypothetical protein
MKKGFRNANIGIAVSAVVLAAGFIPFHGNEGAMEALAVGAFAVGMAVLFLLDWRDERVQRGGTRRSH